MSSSSSSSSTTLEAPSFFRKMRAPIAGLLLINVAVGGYFWISNELEKKKVKGDGPEAITKAEALLKKESASESLSPAPVAKAPVEKKSVYVSEGEQREILTWMLQEKRKVKPTNKTQKASINQDKQLIKDFLRAKELPRLV